MTGLTTYHTVVIALIVLVLVVAVLSVVWLFVRRTSRRKSAPND